MSGFKIKIDGKEIEARDGETIMQIATRENIFIPALCYHCDIKAHESCRLCLVEAEGERGLRASCNLKAKPDMKVKTDTPEIKKSLRINLELLFAQHKGKCDTCDRKETCKLRALVFKYDITSDYPDRKQGKAKYQFGPSIKFDPEKCINCENCSEMCARQTGVGFLRPRESQYNFEVCPSKNAVHDCLYCGQCITHCPVGALSEVEDWPKVKDLLSNPTKKVIFQFAPAIRTAIGEEFGGKPGDLVTDKLFSALKKIGAYKVFDTSFAADVTVIEEVKELQERIKEGKTEVMMSSCCPAWVKYVEFYEPQFLPNLTTVRSPQIIMGGLIKNYWAKENKVRPKDIVVISIMPCTAKKFEATRSELFANGQKPVDFVLTTRELAKLFREYDIDLLKIESDPTAKKELLADATGAGDIFGASGGVLEAALRTAYFKFTGKNLAEIEIKDLHQYEGIKTAEVEIGESKMEFVAVNGLNNAREILSELKENPKKYVYLEVMACPGGCIGGGGQPIPYDHEIRKKRAAGLYKSDRERPLRLAHESKDVKKLYDDFLTNDKICKKICTTKYRKRNKGKIEIIK